MAWQVEHTNTDKYIIVAGNGNVAVAYNEHDARLIAKAPELLAALKSMLDWSQGDNGPGAFHRDRAKARAVLEQVVGASRDG